ncbi:MAG: TatD family hydrolase [Raineya sp.]
MNIHLKHLFYDIHSHKTQNNKDVWQLNNLTLPKDTIDSIYFLNQPVSVGYHPWFLQENNYQTHLQLLEELAQNDKVWAIGETGLDKVVRTDFLLQLKVFQKHIAISEETKKPLIIHCVKAYSEVLSLHKQLRPTQKWLIHGFGANKQIATQLQAKGIYLSFGEALFKRPQLQEIFALSLPDYFLLETDNSNIAIEKVYEKAAQIREISLKELQNQVKKNLCKFFG